MIIKCNRRTFEITEKDVVVYNGACYSLLTQTYSNNYSYCHPKIAKAKAKQMIKDGILVPENETDDCGATIKLYRFNVRRCD